jgi:hypothetical protein
MRLRILTAGLLAVSLGAAGVTGVANARPEPIDPVKVQDLAGGIESALGSAGCSATPRQDMDAIRTAIAGSGATPREAQAALAVVQSSPGLCGHASAAVASVNERITVALEGSGPGAGPAGGPSGGEPLGSPPAYVGGGGSNYQAP